MRRHTAAEEVLRDLTTEADEFRAAQFLIPHVIGIGSLARFLAEGWIVHDPQHGERYRITDKGRTELAALAALPTRKGKNGSNTL